jgi:predicted P-loop ATPase
VTDDNVIPLPARGWAERCLLDKNKKLLPIAANALEALRGDPSMRDGFAYNEMLCMPVLRHEIGRVFDLCDRPMLDHDITSLQILLQRNGLHRIGWQTVGQVADYFSRENSFHPVRDHFESLVWDGQPRLNCWPQLYLGVPPSPYSIAIGRMFLISMVARILEPGCKADHMIVLEGAQGSGKSTAINILAGGDEFFSDALPVDLAHKDASSHLRGKLLVEIAEMHSLDRTTSALLKSYLTRRHERYRPSYARYDVIEPRQCTFAGTTNEDFYLRDTTGGRRFWPMRTGDIDLDGLAANRDQLIAEAVDEYRRGAQWWPPRDFEREHMHAEQEKRLEPDAWREPIVDYIERQGVSEISVAALALHALGLSFKSTDRKELGRIAGIMRGLKWELKHTKRGNVWRRPGYAGEAE